MKLVLIEWNDSCSAVNSHWKPLEDIEGVATHCRSVGWVIKESKACVVLAAHISGEKNNFPYYKGELTIPRHAILKMRTLSAVRKVEPKRKRRLPGRASRRVRK